MPHVISIIFIIALFLALFPSADGAITCLLLCIDILGIKRNEQIDEKQKKKIRRTVHLAFAFVFSYWW